MICCYDPGCVSTELLCKYYDFSIEESIKKGCIDVKKWGKINYSFIVNKLNRNEHNGKHVFGVNAIKAYSTLFPHLKQFLLKYDTYNSSKL